MDAWAPIAISARQLQGSARGFSVVARLMPSVTILQAQAEMDRIAAGIARDFPARSAGWGVLVEPLQTALYGSLQEPLLLLAAAVGLVLLVACANVAGLLLARASGRTTEMAVRAAIGANRARIMRQLLTESVLLAAAGGLAGVGVGWVAMKLLIVTAPATLPRLQSVGLDNAVLAYTAALAALSGIVFGLVPALQASRPNLSEALRASARVAGDRVRHRLRSGLVTAQVALAVVLLVGATLMIRSLVALQTSDLGGDPNDVLAFDVMFSQTRFQKGVGTYAGRPLVEVSPVPSQTYTRIWEALQSVPGVYSAAGINFVPFAAAALPTVPFTIEGRPLPVTPEEAQLVAARTAIVTPNVFATMSIPILRGRDFTTRDTETTPWGVVINTAMAEKFWADENPLGQRVTLSTVQDEQPRQVIGVVGNARLTPFDLRPEPIMYVLHNQQPLHARGGLSNWQRLQMTFLVRTEQPGSAMLPLLRHTLGEIDPERPMTEVRRVEDLVGSRLDQTRYTVIVLGAFAAVAVLLAVVGLYGVVAYGVAQRTREIGIRLALGAGRIAVLTLVLRHTLTIVMVALILGILAAFAASGLVSSVLWSIAPTDPVTYAFVCVMMTIVALVAAAVPARRAIQVAPTVALRQE
jgi:putative ABC transport system permease protein